MQMYNSKGIICFRKIKDLSKITIRYTNKNIYTVSRLAVAPFEIEIPSSSRTLE